MNTHSQKKTKKLYRYLAKHYDRVTKMFNPLFGSSTGKEFSKLMVKYIKSGSKILDVGVGTGRNIERAIKEKIHFSSYEGIDLTPEMLSVAKQKFSHLDNISFQTGDITTMDIKKKYDAIVSTLVFSHLTEQDKIIQKLLSALNPGGVLLIMFFSEGPAKQKRNRNRISYFFHSMFRLIAEPVFKLNLVPSKMLAKFPPAKVEKHFTCWGPGRMSIYVFQK